MIFVSKDHFSYHFDPNLAPATTVEVEERFEVETMDCFSDELKTESDLFTDLDMAHINPCTGPVYVKGAQPGDVIALKIEKITLRDWGILTLIPAEGVLQRLTKSPVSKIVKIHQKSGDDGYVEYGPNIRVSLRPHIGTIGTSPNLRFPTGHTGIHGGNMDIRDLGEGSVIYMPVFVPGGLISLGDVHANMGNAEIAIGVETGAKIELSVQAVYENTFLRAPMIETPTHWITYAEATSGQVGLYDLCTRMAEFLCSRTGVSVEDAALLISITGDVSFGQWAESGQNYTFYLKFPKDVFTDGKLSKFQA